MTIDRATQVANNAVAVTIIDPSQSLTIDRQPGLPGADVGFTVASGPFNDLTRGGDMVHQYQVTGNGNGFCSKTGTKSGDEVSRVRSPAMPAISS